MFAILTCNQLKPKTSIQVILIFYIIMTENTLKTGNKSGKSSKPLIERQRRARINQRLEEIKDLILSFLYQDDPQMYSEKRCVRMDKAEILDFAVEFIKQQKNTQNAHYKISKQYPMQREQFIAPAFPWQHPVLQTTLPLPGSNLQIFPRVMPLQSVPNGNKCSTSNLTSYYGLDCPKTSPIEVKQPTSISATKPVGLKAVWRPWN